MVVSVARRGRKLSFEESILVVYMVAFADLVSTLVMRLCTCQRVLDRRHMEHHLLGQVPRLIQIVLLRVKVSMSFLDVGRIATVLILGHRPFASKCIRTSLYCFVSCGLSAHQGRSLCNTLLLEVPGGEL